MYSGVELISKKIQSAKQKWKKYTQGWTGNIIYVVLGFVIAYSLNLVLGFALGTDMPVVAVVSNSMVPSFYKGDLLVVIGEKNIKEGDVIVYDVSSAKYPIIHRVIRVNPDRTFETKGDANPAQIPFEHNITQNQIHGKAVFKIPLLGWVKIIFMQALGML